MLVNSIYFIIKNFLVINIYSNIMKYREVLESAETLYYQIMH